MTSPERGPTKWHESFGVVAIMLIIGVIVTSPCWGLALIAWVTK